MIRIRGGAGLGDSIYLRAVCEYFVARGKAVTALSDWPGVFIGGRMSVQPFTRNNVNVVAHYTSGKANPNTNQWQDICAAAGIGEAKLAFPWEVRNPRLVAHLRAKAAGRPLIVVHGGRTPMGRVDGFGRELMPEREAFEFVLHALADCYRVRIGYGPDAYALPVDVDLNGKTSVPDLIDIVSTCDGVVGQCSLIVPAAEVFDKPLLAVWSDRGLSSPAQYVRLITPRKVLSKPSSRHIVDAWPQESRRDAVGAFRQDIGCREIACAS